MPSCTQEACVLFSEASRGMADLAQFGVGLAAPGRTKRTGAERRKQANALPQDFFVYSWLKVDRSQKGHAKVHGLATLTRISAWTPQQPGVQLQAACVERDMQRDLVIWAAGKYIHSSSDIRLPFEACGSWRLEGKQRGPQRL